MQNYFLRSLIKEKVCHYLPGDLGGGAIMKKVTNSDIGGGGLEFCVFVVTSFLNGSLNKYFVKWRNMATILVIIFRDFLILEKVL